MGVVTEPLWRAHVAHMHAQVRMQHCQLSDELDEAGHRRWSKIVPSGSSGAHATTAAETAGKGARRDGSGGVAARATGPFPAASVAASPSSTRTSTPNAASASASASVSVSYRDAFEWECAGREKRKDAAAARLRGHYGDAARARESRAAQVVNLAPRAPVTKRKTPAGITTPSSAAAAAAAASAKRHKSAVPQQVGRAGDRATTAGGAGGGASSRERLAARLGMGRGRGGAKATGRGSLHPGPEPLHPKS